jgi:general stress protein 26
MDAKKQLYDVANGFRSAMLVTYGRDGVLNARPMAVAELEPDSDAYFSTSLASPKIAEIEADARVLVTFQGGSQFATIFGTVEIVRDRALVERLWTEDWRLWFPKGKDDPTLCLLKLSAERGEYWDTNGLEGVKFLIESVKARVSGRSPEKTEAQNAKIRL